MGGTRFIEKTKALSLLHVVLWARLIDRRRTASAEDFTADNFTLKSRPIAQYIGLLSSGGRYEAGGPVRWAVRGHTGSPEILIPFNGIREGKG